MYCVCFRVTCLPPPNIEWLFLRVCPGLSVCILCGFVGMCNCIYIDRSIYIQICKYMCAPVWYDCIKCATHRWLCIHIYIHIYIVYVRWLCVHIYICIYLMTIYVHIYVHMYTYIYIYTYVYIVYMYIYMYIYVYIYIYIHTHTYIYIYIYIYIICM